MHFAKFSAYLSALLIVLVSLLPTRLWGQQDIKIWAASDGVKVDKYDLNHPFKSGNIVWDGDTVRIFGAKNEVVAFQIVVESGSSPLTLNKTSLKFGPQKASCLNALINTRHSENTTRHSERNAV